MTDGLTGSEGELDDQVAALFERAVATVERLAAASESGDQEDLVALLDDLEDVVDEAEDVLATADLGDLAAAVDWSAVPEVFDAGDLADAVRGEDSDAVTLRKLVAVVNLSALWDATDTRELWRESDELADELADLTGDAEADGDGGSDRSDGGVDAGGVSVGSGFGGDQGDGNSGGGVGDVDPRTLENAAQSQLADAVDEFRETLLAAHDRLASLRAANAERFPDRRGTDSRNPTAVSTLQCGDGTTARGAMRYSTVPRETKYSTAPNRRRVYGPRFPSAGGEDGE